jgi:N-acetylglucosamine-6-phosphate deacetylase
VQCTAFVLWEIMQTSLTDGIVLCLDSAQIPGHDGFQKLYCNGAGTIIDIQSSATPSSHRDLFTHDLQGNWLSLGGVDLQINGGLGLAFPDLQPGQESKLEAVAALLWEQGVDAFLPTIVTTAMVKVQQSLATIAAFTPKKEQPLATIAGVHLEGPFLNPSKRGAHPEAYLQPLSVETVQHLLGDYAAAVKVMTLAPELDPSGAAIAYLRQQNIIVSLGHSQATAAQAQRAFHQGATMVTHAFNAMPPLHHREPGLLGAAVMEPGVWCGLIADGQHIHPLMLKWLLQASQGQELFLVSDALAPLGLPDGIYPWDSRTIEVTRGTARLPDGTLSGTTLPLLDGVKNLVRWGVCSLETAIVLATEAPRQAMGLPGMGVGQSVTHLLCWSSTGDSAVQWERLWPKIANHFELTGKQ